jgi:hypothetical protein
MRESFGLLLHFYDLARSTKLLFIDPRLVIYFSLDGGLASLPR